jgi:hypothetical protein
MNPEPEELVADLSWEPMVPCENPECALCRNLGSMSTNTNAKAKCPTIEHDVAECANPPTGGGKRMVTLGRIDIGWMPYDHHIPTPPNSKKDWYNNRK